MVRTSGLSGFPPGDWEYRPLPQSTLHKQLLAAAASCYLITDIGGGNPVYDLLPQAECTAL